MSQPLQAAPSRALSLTIGQRRAGAIAPRTKALRLLSLAAVNPLEFYDRIRAIAEIRARRRSPTPVRYLTTPWPDMATQAATVLGSTVPWSTDDPGFLETVAQLRQRLSTIDEAPFPALFDADPVLARLSYFLTLALKPAIVIETGVAFGVVSSFILAALARNGHGQLISIDLPPLGVPAAAIGELIPDELRSRWTLVRGAATRVLPRWLAHLPPVGLFVHDSLFTSRNSRQEYALVLPHLAPRSAILANRVDFSDAFAWLANRARPAVTSVLEAEEKANELIGMCLFDQPPEFRYNPAPWASSAEPIIREPFIS